MSIRLRLTIAAIAVILVANSLLSFFLLQYLGRVWMGEVQTRVLRNLNSARAAYRNHLEKISAFLLAASNNQALCDAVKRQDQPAIEKLIRTLGQKHAMDFLGLTNAQGLVLSRLGSKATGDVLNDDPLIGGVLSRFQPMRGSLVFSPQRLQLEGPELAARATLSVIPTTAARPTTDRERREGLVVAAAVPLWDAEKKLLGVLYGGDLLNQRYEIVDAIKQQVFPGDVYKGKEIGTVTIFLGDLRISTNVIGDDGRRAVGTRLSAQVCEAVLDRGETWAAPAFVVNDWYITAYEPIRDPTNKIIGVLYVGLLQAPFTHQLRVISFVFLSIIGGTTLVSLLLLLWVNALVLRPIRLVIEMAQKVISGDLTARVGIRPAGEMGALCRAVDSMAQAVAEREELLTQATRQQIRRSEQLAAVGRLAAGVAHEINNPLTGVLTFAELLLEKENLDQQDRKDLELIIRETKRAREIVRGLLDYARETPFVKAPLNVNDLVRQTTQLLGKREAFQQVNIVEALAENLPLIEGDRHQLQQVLMNLALNACEAMPDGGTLLLGTAAKDNQVIIEVTDTGCGIKPEHLDHIFEPFFTTKPVGKGTGLGLSVSVGIIQQHGGTLEVESSVGKGTTFTITLPAAGREKA